MPYDVECMRPAVLTEAHPQFDLFNNTMGYDIEGWIVAVDNGQWDYRGRNEYVVCPFLFRSRAGNQRDQWIRAGEFEFI